MKTTLLARRLPSYICLIALLGVFPIALTGCDKDTSTSKTSTTKTVSTPEGVKKTTETTEKTVETEKK